MEWLNKILVEYGTIPRIMILALVVSVVFLIFLVFKTSNEKKKADLKWLVGLLLGAGIGLMFFVSLDKPYSEYLNYKKAVLDSFNRISIMNSDFLKDYASSESRMVVEGTDGKQYVKIHKTTFDGYLKNAEKERELIKKYDIDKMDTRANPLRIKVDRFIDADIRLYTDYKEYISKETEKIDFKNTFKQNENPVNFYYMDKENSDIYLFGLSNFNANLKILLVELSLKRYVTDENGLSRKEIDFYQSVIKDNEKR